MNKVIKKYIINENTLALVPAKEIAYDTIAIEKDKKLYIRKTPLQLMEAASCYNDWSTYEGRRQAVIYHTNFKRKVPIPINIHKGIYFFPTHAQRSTENNWIAFHHVAHLSPTTDENNSPQTMIIFTNGTTLLIDLPIQILEKQMQRTFACINKLRMIRGSKAGFWIIS